MQRDFRFLGSVFLVVLGAVVVQQAAAGCSDKSDCSLAPPGQTFTFHVTNTGTADRRLTYRCGATLPITLTTPQGELSIGPGEVSSCEFSCEDVYDEGSFTDACFDCGPGSGALLGPGMTADIPWDRRVYVKHTIDPGCAPGKASEFCARGEPVAPSSAQKGVLTVCVGGSSSGSGPGWYQGYCPSTDAIPRRSATSFHGI